MTRGVDWYDLTLGLPHTNHFGLAEPLLLMHAGHFHWTSIASAIGAPLSRLRTVSGGEVYAAFYYIEERLPAGTPLERFGLDDVVRFGVVQRAFKNIVIEARIVFDTPQALPKTSLDEAPWRPSTEVAHPFIHFGTIFITPVTGNSGLRVAPPASIDLSTLAPLPNDENPYQLVRAAQNGAGLGVLDHEWATIDSFEHVYRIDADRDTNGAGLVYFANYVAFMETAERLALGHMTSGITGRRSLRHRRIAYYGNADIDDTIVTRVTLLRHHATAASIGVRYAIERQRDRQTICLSEAVKALRPS
jgi:probable biosynthetic protein (TIGR04098 family)